MRQIVLDTETTGLSPQDGDRIIEIGCVELVNRQLTGNNRHFYLNPERDIHEDALRVHGITLEFLADKPRFADIAAELADYLQGAELIIHNAPFDLGFLDAEFGRLGSGPRAAWCAGSSTPWSWPRRCGRANATGSMPCATAWAWTIPAASCMARCSTPSCWQTCTST
jgi:DNA polymerase III epsilon subunit-like protein